MQIDIFLTTLLAGMAYVLIPGPATLAALNLSATKGRRTCCTFLVGHLLGDLFWASLAIAAIIGTSYLGPALFQALGMICGMYLIYLGGRALISSQTNTAPLVVNPWRSGLIFGLTNPKAYPFAIAMFASVLSRFEGTLVIGNATFLVIAAFCGFIVATALVVFWTGLPAIRYGFLRYGLVINRAIGVIFVVLGAKIVVDATADYAPRFKR